MKKYFITDNETLGLQASQFIHAKYSGKYFEEAKEQVKDAEFMRVNELYDTLANSDGDNVTIILSKFAKAWESSLRTKYPKAIIEDYQEGTSEENNE